MLAALVHDPVLGEAYRRLALHYDFLISPTRPATPRHKGKVESGVHYVQRNFLAGQEFVDIDTGNARLKIWVRDVAGSRTHGTTLIVTRHPHPDSASPGRPVVNSTRLSLVNTDRPSLVSTDRPWLVNTRAAFDRPGQAGTKNKK